MKVSETSSPTTLANTIAIRRWRCIAAQPKAPTSNAASAAQAAGSDGCPGQAAREWRRRRAETGEAAKQQGGQQEQHEIALQRHGIERGHQPPAAAERQC